MFDEKITDTKNKEGKGLETVKDNTNTPSAQQILKAYQTVFLFKWLFPESVIQKHVEKYNRTGRSQSKTSTAHLRYSRISIAASLTPQPARHGQLKVKRKQT
jgi:hypothetical protein